LEKDPEPSAVGTQGSEHMSLSIDIKCSGKRYTRMQISLIKYSNEVALISGHGLPPNCQGVYGMTTAAFTVNAYVDSVTGSAQFTF